MLQRRVIALSRECFLRKSLHEKIQLAWNFGSDDVHALPVIAGTSICRRRVITLPRERFPRKPLHEKIRLA